jgi:hypothetical protein
LQVLNALANTAPYDGSNLIRALTASALEITSGTDRFAEALQGLICCIEALEAELKERT